MVRSLLKKVLMQVFLPETLRNSLALLDQINAYRGTQVIYVATKLGIIDLLQKEPNSIIFLAEQTRTNVDALYRLLRALASLGILREIKPQFFALTAKGKLLASDHPDSLRDVALLNGENWNWQPWGELLKSIQNGQPIFEQMFGQSFFDYLGENPTANEIFDGSMSNFSQLENPTLVNAYDFSGISCLVDVGGGEGQLLSAIIKANPTLKGILFDFPQAIATAQRNLANQGLSDRLETIAGDFTTSIPSGGEVYLLKSVIHMFDDEKALQLLQNCHQAMTTGNKLLLVETVLPLDDEPFVGKMVDLQMLIQLGGRERTEAEYRTLLGKAGFQLTRIYPTRSPKSFIEAIYL